MNEKRYDLTSGALPLGIVISVVMSVIGGTAVAVKTMVDVSNEVSALRTDMNYKLEIIQRDQRNIWTRAEMQAWSWELKARNSSLAVPEIERK